MSAVSTSNGLVGSPEVQIAYTVAKTARRVFREQGDAAVQLIKSAGDVARATQHRPRANGLGGTLDVKA